MALRSATPADYAAFARLFLELGVREPPPPADVWASELLPRTWFHEGPEGPRAYVTADVMGDLGYVVQLVVDASARRQGLGRQMMQEVAAHFRARGCTRWGLNVKRDNTAALALYGSLGMKPLREAVTLVVSQAQGEALSAAPGGLQVVPVVEAEWVPLTAAWQLMPEKLARFSKFASHQLLRLDSPAAPEPLRLGMMDLRQGGGLFPFFAATPGHARALLEDAFRRSGVQELSVTVTDNVPLVEVLRAAGAGTAMETYQLQGPLP